MSFEDKAEEFATDSTLPDIDIGTAKIASTHEDGSDDWSAARSKGVGGSDAATILGLKPYGNTREELWKEKTGRAQNRVANEHTRFGTLIEEYVRKWLRKRAADTPSIFGEFEHLVDFPAQLVHPHRHWQRGNTDGMICTAAHRAYIGLEIKHGRKRHGHHSKKWTDEGALRIHYPQMQHYMAVTGFKRWMYVYVHTPFAKEMQTRLVDEFVPEDRTGEAYEWIVDYADDQVDEPVICEIERDDSYIEYLTAAEDEFWQAVEDDTPPGEFLPEGTVEVEDDELAGLLDQYGKAHARIKAAGAPKAHKKAKEAAKEEIKQRAQAIAAANGDVKEIRVGEDRVVWNARGYWMAKPAERDPDEDTDPVVPF